jgi:hypothetical protein
MAECLARTLPKSQRKKAEIFCDKIQQHRQDNVKLETRKLLCHFIKLRPNET